MKYALEAYTKDNQSLTMKGKKYFDEINLLKGWCMILAVVGHSLPDVTNGFNIIGEGSFSEFIYHWIYSFHMPTFFACAGFLMLPKLKTSGSPLDQLKKRFIRLMVPYFFFSFMYLGMKTFFGQFADHPLSEGAFWGVFLGDSPCFGAWFLWTLFVISCIAILLRKLSWQVLLFISVVLYIINQTCDLTWMPVGFTRVMGNMIWLVIGGVIGLFYGKISCNKSKALFYAIVGFAILTLSYFLASGLSSYVCIILSLIKTLAGIIGSWGLVMYVLPSTKNLFHKLVKIIGDYCMDIYMLSMFVLVPMRIIYVNLGVMNFVNYYVWVLIATCTGIVIPIIASKYLVRKSKWLKMLLIGG